MEEIKKIELNTIIGDKLIQTIKARILRNCVAENDIKEVDIFRDYINSLNRDETMFLWNTVKALGWIDFINCINDSLEDV